MLDSLLTWLLSINLFTFFAYWLDKRRARQGQRRISERTLLLAAIIGGSPAALLAMKLFRHKTRKLSFRISYWSIVVVQVTAAIGYFGFRE